MRGCGGARVRRMRWGTGWAESQRSRARRAAGRSSPRSQASGRRKQNMRATRARAVAKNGSRCARGVCSAYPTKRTQLHELAQRSAQQLAIRQEVERHRRRLLQQMVDELGEAVARELRGELERFVAHGILVDLRDKAHNHLLLGARHGGSCSAGKLPPNTRTETGARGDVDSTRVGYLRHQHGRQPGAVRAKSRINSNAKRPWSSRRTQSRT